MNILNTFRILRSFCNTNQQESHGTAAAIIPRVDAVHKYLHRFIHQEITSSNASVHLININDSEVFAVLLPSISEPYRTNHEFPSFHRVYKITHWSPAPEYLRSWASKLILDQELQRRSPKHQSTIHTGCFFPSPCALCTCIEMCFYGSDTQRTQKKKTKKTKTNDCLSLTHYSCNFGWRTTYVAGCPRLPCFIYTAVHLGVTFLNKYEACCSASSTCGKQCMRSGLNWLWMLCLVRYMRKRDSE